MTTNRQAASARAEQWRRDYSRCHCPSDYESCPHCGAHGIDHTHRGRCHARVSG